MQSCTRSEDSPSEAPIPSKPRYPIPIAAVPARMEAKGTDTASKIAKLSSVGAEPTRRRRGALPDDLLWRSEEEAARRLALKNLSAAVAAERRLDDRSDPEALHDFRVSVRRLRSVLRAYRQQLGGAVRRKDRRDLRRVQRATGSGREAEVALEWLTKQQPTLQPEHLPGLNWLSATLLERRRRCSTRLDAEIRASFRKIATRLEQRLAIMRVERNLLLQEPFVSFALCVADLTEAHAANLSTTLGRIANMDDMEKLHASRISGKRLRYLLEPVRPYVNEAQRLVKQSKRLQDVLGDLNDVHVLMREIGNALETSMEQRAERVRASLRGDDIDRARREASMSEWSGFIELRSRLNQERRTLTTKLRDQWLNSQLDGMVAEARGLAQRLRSMDLD